MHAVYNELCNRDVKSARATSNVEVEAINPSYF